jgi:hypothetical protein
MAADKSALQSADHRVFELGPPMVERASLESVPSAGSVEFYFLTAAAERAWAATNAARTRGAGALFWIGGPAGAGKTHFLNYVLALEERAGAGAGRRANVRVEAEGCARADALEQRLLEGLARALGGNGPEAALWRRIRGAQALEIALDHARRVGIRAVSVAIDLGTADPAAADKYFAELARSIAAPRALAFNLFVAARAAAPVDALALEVAPANDDERILAAMARARRVLDVEAAAALYRGVDCGGLEPRAIFPFHPLALSALHAAVGQRATIAALAHLIAEVLVDHRERAVGAYERPVLSVELLQVAAVARRVAERLGEGGRAALAIAYRAADTMKDRTGAREIVDALMLEALGGGPALSLRDMRARLPGERTSNGANGAGLAGLLAALAPCSAGVVVFDGRAARFDARAAGAGEVAAFNAALALARRFDATLSAAAEPPELRDRLKRLEEAMRSALEEAQRVAAVVEAAERAAHGALADEHRRTLDDFSALAAGGARALVALGADAARREQAVRTVAAYEDLAMAAAAAARMSAMREYLRATRLRPDLAREEAAANGAIAALTVECQLLLAALDAGVLPDARRRFEALEARFEKFKWTYVAAYRAAHACWRRESERLAVELGEAREHFAALARLNSIAALGAPQGTELGARIEELGRGIGRCEDEAPIGPEAARCGRCGFVLGTALPERELGEVLDQVKRTLRARLAALSHGAIARLIRLHDRGRRLDGFLKITQAAHTEALVRVLDDNLAAYLAQLLEEVGDEAVCGEEPLKTPANVIRHLARPRRNGPNPGPRAERPAKPPQRQS